MTRLAVLLLAAVLLAGCQATRSAPAASVPAAPTGTSSAAGPTSTARPTPSAVSAAPSPVEGDCPYLDAGFVQDTVGQHIDRTTVTATSHESLPTCTFYRPDGDPAAEVALTELATAVAAQTAAIRIGTPAADPVDGIADGGVVLASPGQTVLAVSSGSTLLVVTINQESSLEARAIAAQVASQLTG